MPEGELTQAEADALIAMAKYCVSDEEWRYPGLGSSISIPFASEDRREAFLLDISRGRIDLVKGKYQTRSRQTIILARLDFGSQPHRNPDGEEIGSPHLHLYREGYGHKWASRPPVGQFPNTSDLWRTFEDFMVFCNIVARPNILRGLFV